MVLKVSNAARRVRERLAHAHKLLVRRVPLQVRDLGSVDVCVLLDLAHQMRLVGKASAAHVPPVPVDLGDL